MASTQIPLGSGTVTSPSKDTIYTNTGTDPVQPFLVISNALTTVSEVVVYVDDGTNDTRILRRKIAPGVGKSIRAIELSDTRLAANDSVSIEALGGTVDYFLSGIVFAAE